MEKRINYLNPKYSLLLHALGINSNETLIDERLVLDSSNNLISKAAKSLNDYSDRLNIDKFVLGLSGGLDSAYVSYVAKVALELRGLSPSNLILVTLPGFGTGNSTFNNALSLIKDYGATHINIDIKDICTMSLKSMGIDSTDRSTAFENIQARVRTMILLTLANKYNALELGTGDFSESALGWCTYGGDNISMYNVNATLPKTLIRESMYLIGKYSGKDYLYNIASSPITPELLPSTDGKEFEQKTEDSIGSYDLIDYLLYLVFIKKNDFDESIKLANENLIEFKDKKIGNKSYVEHYGNIFKKRFNSMAFKRLNCPYPNLTDLIF